MRLCTVSEAWDILNTHILGESTFAKNRILKSIVNKTYKKGDTMETFMKEFDGAVSQYKSMKGVLDVKTKDITAFAGESAKIESFSYI